MTNVTGRLEGWYLETYAKGSIVWDYLYDDTRNRWWDGARIHTSKILSGIKDLKEGDVIITMNSSYLLGKPFEKED